MFKFILNNKIDTKYWLKSIIKFLHSTQIAFWLHTFQSLCILVPQITASSMELFLTMTQFWKNKLSQILHKCSFLRKLFCWCFSLPAQNVCQCWWSDTHKLGKLAHTLCTHHFVPMQCQVLGPCCPACWKNPLESDKRTPLFVWALQWFQASCSDQMNVDRTGWDTTYLEYMCFVWTHSCTGWKLWKWQGKEVTQHWACQWENMMRCDATGWDRTRGIFAGMSISLRHMVTTHDFWPRWPAARRWKCCLLLVGTVAIPGSDPHPLNGYCGGGGSQKALENLKEFHELVLWPGN